MKEFIGLRAKTYNYIKGNNDEDKKSKIHKKNVSQKEDLNLKIIKTLQKQLKSKFK